MDVTYTLTFDQYDALKSAAAYLSALQAGDHISARMAETLRSTADKALAVHVRPVAHLTNTTA